MVWKTTDDGFTAIKDAWLNNTVIGLAILDGNSGGQGFQADFNITGFRILVRRTTTELAGI